MNIETLRAYRPQFRRLGLLYHANEPNSVMKRDELASLSKSMGLELLAQELPLGPNGRPKANEIAAATGREDSSWQSDSWVSPRAAHDEVRGRHQHAGGQEAEIDAANGSAADRRDCELTTLRRWAKVRSYVRRMPQHYATATVARLVDAAKSAALTRDRTTLLRVANG